MSTSTPPSKPRKKPEELRSQQWWGRQDRDGFIYRSWVKGKGVPHDQFDGRPVIGICNTFSELTPCNSHFRTLAEQVASWWSTVECRPKWARASRMPSARLSLSKAPATRSLRWSSWNLPQMANCVSPASRAGASTRHIPTSKDT